MKNEKLQKEFDAHVKEIKGLCTGGPLDFAALCLEREARSSGARQTGDEEHPAAADAHPLSGSKQGMSGSDAATAVAATEGATQAQHVKDLQAQIAKVEAQLAELRQPQSQEAKTGGSKTPDTTTQPCAQQSLLSADAVAAALEAVPAEDWSRTWAADRTIMLRMTSKRFQELVDKLRPPAFVRWRRAFLEDELNGTADVKVLFVLRQLDVLARRCRISTLDLGFDGDNQFGRVHPCSIKEKGAERLAEVLEQCPALGHLALGCNNIGPGGAERIARVLLQCPALAHLDLGGNNIGMCGGGMFAGDILVRVLAKCPALLHLNFYCNQLGVDGAGKLAAVLPLCPALAYLDLSYNLIQADGAAWIGRVLPQ